MTLPIRKLATGIAALLATASVLCAEFVLFPNGDFEAGDTSWTEGGTATFSYPTTGGNPGGYGVIDAGIPFAIWVANGGETISLDSLGLTAGETYTFQQDMITLTAGGGHSGGIKIESWSDTGVIGDSGDMFNETESESWETYFYEYTIEPGSTGLKIVPLWGENAEIGFDNIGVNNRPFSPPADIFDLSIDTQTVVSWTPDFLPSTFSYQPQRSDDGINFEDFGPLIVGSDITSVFDPVGAAFYQVVELETILDDVSSNGSFETEDGLVPGCAESWACLGSQAASRISDNARTGDFSMRLAVANAGSEANNSEIQQNIFLAGGVIVPGTSYDLSFWAQQISFGVSYVQNFRIQWLNDEGGILPGGTEFMSFTGGIESWVEFKVTGLVPPEGATTGLIQIFGATGAVSGGIGEVLIDDVSLSGATTNVIEEYGAETAPGTVLSWPTELGQSYQLRCSTDLIDWQALGSPISGDGETATASDLITSDTKFYDVVETPEA